MKNAKRQGSLYGYDMGDYVRESKAGDNNEQLCRWIAAHP